MNCEDVKTKLIDYYEGELRDKERVSIEGHLRKCGECLGELDQFIYTLELTLQSSAVPELPDTFWSQFTIEVLNKIQQEEKKKEMLWPFQIFNVPHVRLNFATVTWMMLLIFMLGFLGYHGYVNYLGDQNLPTPTVTREEESLKVDVDALFTMFQKDPQGSEDLVNSILDGITLDKVEDILNYELVLLEMNSEMNSVFDIHDIEGTEAYIEALLKDLNEQEKEILLSKLYNMI